MRALTTMSVEVSLILGFLGGAVDSDSTCGCGITVCHRDDVFDRASLKFEKLACLVHSI